MHSYSTDIGVLRKSYRALLKTVFSRFRLAKKAPKNELFGDFWGFECMTHKSN